MHMSICQFQGLDGLYRYIIYPHQDKAAKASLTEPKVGRIYWESKSFGQKVYPLVT